MANILKNGPSKSFLPASIRRRNQTPAHSQSLSRVIHHAKDPGAHFACVSLASVVYLQAWMYVVTADADMKQLAITKYDGNLWYCRWVDSTFETQITNLLTDTYESAFALNKWIFMEIGAQSAKLYGRLLARGGGIRRLAESGSWNIRPDDSITTPISASAFSVTSK